MEGKVVHPAAVVHMGDLAAVQALIAAAQVVEQVAATLVEMPPDMMAWTPAAAVALITSQASVQVCQVSMKETE